MVDVQTGNGFTRIANELLEVMALQKLNGTQLRIIIVIWRYTYGFQRKKHEFSLTFLSTATGIHKQQIKTELDKLIELKIVKVESESTHTKSRELSFNKHYDEWNNLQSVKQLTVSESTDTTVSENTYPTVSESTYQERNIKENIKETIPFKKIIDHLNEKTGKNFSHQTKKTKDLISARWNEGKRLDDFIRVIDYFTVKWDGLTFNGVPAEKYLQPSTLFNGKFDERVNEATSSKDKKTTPTDERTNRRVELQKRLDYLEGEIAITSDPVKSKQLDDEYDQVRKELNEIWTTSR